MVSGLYDNRFMLGIKNSDNRLTEYSRWYLEYDPKIAAPIVFINGAQAMGAVNNADMLGKLI